jgi:hypothetical protein
MRTKSWAKWRDGTAQPHPERKSRRGRYDFLPLCPQSWRKASVERSRGAFDEEFSKELVRISLLGLGVYGILIKMTTDEHGSRFLDALREHRTVPGAGVAAFAVCAGCALFHGFLATKCLGHQLVIARYFGRLEGARWSERYHELFRDIIRRQQQRQKLVLRAGNLLLWISTIALISGAVCAASCFALVIFNK